MKKSLIAASLITVLTGCQSNSATVKEAQNFAPCTFPDAPTVEAPGWICDVYPTDIYIAATGFSEKNIAGLGLMRKIAVNNARANLAAQFETKAQNLFEQAIETVSTKSLSEGVTVDTQSAKQNVQNITKTVVSRTLSNSRVMVSQASPAGGLYILVGMDQTTYDANMNKIIDEVSGQNSALWEQFNNEKTAAELNAVLDKLKK